MDVLVDGGRAASLFDALLDGFGDYDQDGDQTVKNG